MGSTTDISTIGVPTDTPMALHNRQTSLRLDGRVDGDTTFIIYHAFRSIKSVLPVEILFAEPWQQKGARVALQMKFSSAFVIDVFGEPEPGTNVIDVPRADDEDEWFREAIRLHDGGETARALDAVFDKIDDWLCGGRFPECDAFLGRGVDVESTPTQLLLAILTVTLPAGDKLFNRDAVFARAWKTMSDRGKDVRRLLGRLRASHGVTPKRSPDVNRPPRFN